MESSREERCFLDVASGAAVFQLGHKGKELSSLCSDMEERLAFCCSSNLNRNYKPLSRRWSRTSCCAARGSRKTGRDKLSQLILSAQIGNAQIGYDQDGSEKKRARKPVGVPDKVLEEIEELLGYTFTTKSLLRLALIHSSVSQERLVYVAKGEDPIKADNERLEYLGDAILYMALAEILYKLRPTLTEGEMTGLRGRLLTREACATYVRNLGVEKFLIFGRYVRRYELRQSTTVLGDFFEALLGAIYLDGGLNAAREFIREQVLPTVPELLKLNAEVEGSLKKNYRNRLQSYLQRRHRVLPSVAEEKVVGPDHDKRFTYSVYLRDQLLGTGEGVTKKQAINVACLNALEALGVNPNRDETDEDNDEEATDEKEEEDSGLPPCRVLLEDEILPSWPKGEFKVSLNRDSGEFFQSVPRLVSLERDEEFIYAVSLDGSLVSSGSGRTKKEAEQRAARRFMPVSKVCKLLGKAEASNQPDVVAGLLNELASITALIAQPPKAEEAVQIEKVADEESTTSEESDSVPAVNGAVHVPIESEDTVVSVSSSLGDSLAPEAGENNLADPGNGADSSSTNDKIRDDSGSELDGEVQTEEEEDVAAAEEKHFSSRRYDALGDCLEKLHEYGVLYSPCIELSYKDVVDVMSMTRWVERIARTSGLTAGVVAAHFAATVNFCSRTDVPPKVFEEVIHEVLSKKTIFCNIDLLGTIEPYVESNGRRSLLLQAKSNSSVLGPRHITFFLARVYPDEESLLKDENATEVFLPAGENLAFEFDEQGVQSSGKLVCDGVIVPRAFVLGLPSQQHEVIVPEAEKKEASAASDGNTSRKRKIAWEKTNALYRALLGATESGLMRAADRIIDAVEKKPSSEVEWDKLRDLLRASVEGCQTLIDKEWGGAETDWSDVFHLSQQLADLNGPQMASSLSRLETYDEETIAQLQLGSVLQHMISSGHHLRRIRTEPEFEVQPSD